MVGQDKEDQMGSHHPPCCGHHQVQALSDVAQQERDFGVDLAAGGEVAECHTVEESLVWVARGKLGSLQFLSHEVEAREHVLGQSLEEED